MEIKRYKQDAAYSYALGMAPAVELIEHKKEAVRGIYVHPDYRAKDGNETIFDICRRAGIPCEVSGKIFGRLAVKGNTYVIGVFEKFETQLEQEAPHVVLVNPEDAGNLGTILRTGLGFGFRDYAIIKPGVDIFGPKTVRASMGAVFHVRFSYYDAFECYRRRFMEHEIYSFLLDGERNLKEIAPKSKVPFSLVFGSEGAGLPECFHGYGESVRISHSREIDSLNLAVAFGIAASVFTNCRNS